MTVPESNPPTLKAKNIGIEASDAHIVYMKADCDVCRAEGFAAQARVQIHSSRRTIIATVHQVTSDILSSGEAGLSRAAWDALDLEDGDEISFSHPAYLESFHIVRSKIFGKRLDDRDMMKIMADLVKGRFSDTEISAFVTACAAQDLNHSERTALTAAMVNVGEKLDWGKTPIVDKHCIGGIPNNRTTPIVVSIVAANGLFMPKTSSRAITSPAGTADTMETLTTVELSLPVLRKVVEDEGGCLAWGGAIKLSPTDDMLIRIERALDIDSDGQLVASVLSKKIAAGASHLILDIPYGPSAKVRSLAKAQSLRDSLTEVSDAFDLKTRTVLCEVFEPVGRGIGPALEARDVLSVLNVTSDAPNDLRQRAINLAGALLEMAGKTSHSKGQDLAAQTLDSGKAWRKFVAICDAQGGLREPPIAAFIETFPAPKAGRVIHLNNRKLAQTAKLLGAPDAKAAGILMKVKLHEVVLSGQPLFELHAETPGELEYAKSYIFANTDIFEILDA